VAKKQLQKVLGLMSGTSADGADVALIATDGENAIEFFGGLTLPYDRELRARLLEASQHDVPLLELARIERDITLHHADAVAELLRTLPRESEGTNLIGFHGHTVRHVVSELVCWQISNPWLLAEKTGMRVVSDFRRHDIAVGGQGAPLVSMFHRALFPNEPRPTVILNLGGVANITWLGENEEIIAGDTGPGCGLLDEWIEEMSGQSHDVDGQIAQRGQVNQGIVDAALATPVLFEAAAALGRSLRVRPRRRVGIKRRGRRGHAVRGHRAGDRESGAANAQAASGAVGDGRRRAPSGDHADVGGKLRESSGGA
jgi:anhydro-N-acetylmuramic acid kinase